MNNVIGIGSDGKSDFVAFGDDSQTTDSLAYAFLIVRRATVPEVEQRICVLKEKFRIPESVSLHCRILFHEHPRQKAGLSHLTKADACHIVDKAVNIINKNNIILRYAVSDLPHWQAAIGNEITMEGDDAPVTLPVNVNAKAILGMLAQSCFLLPPDRSQGPLASDCEIIASEDATKIQFAGKQRKRADRHYGGFMDIGAPAGMVFRLQPKISNSILHPILQLADIAAYVCSHAHRGEERDRFFVNQLSRVKYWTKSSNI